MARIKSPKPLWDFCTLYTMDLSCEAFITITWKHSLWSSHRKYTWCIWISGIQMVPTYPVAFPQQHQQMARWIRVPHQIGQAACYWLLSESGVPIARISIQAISKYELNSDNIKAKLKQYDDKIEEKLIHLTPITPTNPAIFTM